MKKLILGPLLILGIPQVLVSLFFLFVKAVLGWQGDVPFAYVFISGIMLIVSIASASVLMFDSKSTGWYYLYEREQKQLAAKRERLREKLEEEIGIPRIK